MVKESRVEPDGGSAQRIVKLDRRDEEIPRLVAENECLWETGDHVMEPLVPHAEDILSWLLCLAALS